MLLFLYGLTVMPEIQAVLRPDKTGNTARHMMWAATMAHCVYVPLYLFVGVIGERCQEGGDSLLLVLETRVPQTAKAGDCPQGSSDNSMS
jgi:hypothetical protein